MSDTHIQLEVTKGPCSGVAVSVTSGSLTIGRDPHAGLALTGDQFVSSEHARIVCNEHGVMLKNLSPNGTLVNGKPMVESRLADGDTIAIGVAHLIRVRARPADAAPLQTPMSRGETRTSPLATRTVVASPPPTRVETRPPAAKSVTAAPGAATPAARKSAASAPAPAPAGNALSRMPLWLKAYLLLIVVAAVGLGVMKVTRNRAVGLQELHALETGFATTLKLPEAGTSRVLELLDTAMVHEQRGDTRSAYEAYRELMSARQPVDPRSPVYRYAAARAAALGGK